MPRIPSVPFRDGVGMRTNVTFGLWDRLRILLGWEVRVEATVRTERMVGQIKVEPSRVQLLRPRFLRPQTWPSWRREKSDELFYVGPLAHEEDV